MTSKTTAPRSSTISRNNILSSIILLAIGNSSLVSHSRRPLCPRSSRISTPNHSISHRSRYILPISSPLNSFRTTSPPLTRVNNTTSSSRCSTKRHRNQFQPNNSQITRSNLINPYPNKYSSHLPTQMRCSNSRWSQQMTRMHFTRISSSNRRSLHTQLAVLSNLRGEQSQSHPNSSKDLLQQVVPNKLR